MIISVYVWFVNTCKKRPPPSIKYFMERGESKTNYSYPPQNILEGNGVVFETFTINNLQL